MLLTSIVLTCLVAGPGPADPASTVKVDSSRHEVILTVGPYALPNMPPMEDHAMMDLGASHNTPVVRFVWPVNGWMRGFRIQAIDGQGRVLPRHIMHHLIMVNFDRRQLLYQAAERIMGAGTETEDASIPSSIGIPMPAGANLGVYVAWHNDTGTDLEGVQLQVVLEWTPRSQNPRPLDVMPIYMDVNLTVGATNTFDVPPGHSTKAFEFTMPLSGRLMGIGGHLHDYGIMVRLEEVESGRVLTRVRATRDPKGKVLKMGRQLFGVSGRGLKLEAGRRYRVIAEYDNPTGATLKNGAMAEIVGLFAPEDLSRWPRIDPNDATFQKDLASLNMRGMDHEHMQMEHQ